MHRTIKDGMTPGRIARSAGRGFTLMEMLVGVGAVALVAVGLATIFDSVGKTVTGGRRVSVVNTYAALLESQLRRDFESMDREGFLVIRQQYTDFNDGLIDTANPAVDGVRLTAEQPAPLARPRRIDEIQFVAKGQFESSRQPLATGVRAKSNVAVIYIGHGQMQRTEAALAGGATNLDYKKYPLGVSDRNTDPNYRLGYPAAPGQPENPNQFCSNWTLLRHQTLLVSPDATQGAPVQGTNPYYGFSMATAPGYHRLRNRPTQYALQPAAASLFRAIGDYYPLPGPPESPTPDFTLRAAAALPQETLYPRRSSGLVDIASTTLGDLRAFVTTSTQLPSAINASTAPLPPDRLITPAAAGAVAGSRPTFTELDRMHAWLGNTMPTDSRNEFAYANHNDYEPDALDPDTVMGARMRYEPGPTDMLAALALPDGTAQQQLIKAQRRADQLMLTASNFVPNCTDFEVEWSFGEVAGGQVVWYDLNNPYDSSYEVRINNTVTHTVTDRLIYGFSPTLAGSTFPAELTSYFAWVDPTYTQNVTPQADLKSGDTVPWAWPKLIRVTVTMVDPLDPTIESKFQYIFDVPESSGPQGL